MSTTTSTATKAKAASAKATTTKAAPAKAAPKGKAPTKRVTAAKPSGLAAAAASGHRRDGTRSRCGAVRRCAGPSW